MTSYFKNLKFLAWMFVLMTLFMLPQVVINTYGAGGTVTRSAVRLSQTMLGNIATVNGTGVVVLPTGRELPKSYLGLVYSLCDISACALFLIGWIWLTYFEQVERRQVDRVRGRAARARGKGEREAAKAAQASRPSDRPSTPTPPPAFPPRARRTS